ncbi:hypothetical protein FIU87_10110 [Bacillus sp. THAF10]|uniref:hypothetical protein n=1 Tax=Bacillus sp. THAF10 TaxID=2587848 RepID=UPI00126863D7|nr:hypothetical protein [Bacillus sp. THAF10]QFT88999.1 hypothetical protein FIU87_10110 [Bacillus sp. THAF10]
MTTIIGAFLPILLLLLFFFLLSKGLRKVNFNLSSQKNNLILGGYMGILVIFTVVFFFLPDDEFVRSEQILNHPEESVYDRLLAKENVEGVAKKERIPFKESTLFFQSTDFPDFTVMFERDKELKDELIVSVYPGVLEIDNIDVSSKFPLPFYQTDGNIMTVRNGLPVEVEFHKFNQNFTYRQFNENRYQEHSSSFSDRPIIHVKVPDDLEVKYDPNLDVVEIK